MMKFKENNKAIYLQIAEKICDDVMMGVYQPDCRIPSVREYAASVEVNANTVMRTYDYLQNQGVVYNKRGIGFFIATDARDRILAMRRSTFLDDELGYFFKQLMMLGITPGELVVMYSDYCNTIDQQ